MNGCKQCPAYAKCTVTYRGSACAALRWTYGLDTDPEIVTMTDREKKLTFLLATSPHLCLAENCTYIGAAKDLIANGVTAQKWIPVTERLPERTLPPKDVLVYHDLGCGMFVDRAWYSYDKKRWCSVLGMKLKVTHWMPMPEPPKEA